MAGYDGIVDLDSLVVACRTEQARAYVGEAVACYRAGAYRSCIIATWIAVLYDLLSKFRELELSGDARAKQIVEQFEDIQRQNDVARAQKFESGILDVARNEFELLTFQEERDLERLRVDRHRCAHPTINSSVDELYSPPPELARYHLRTAVTALLAQQPRQGKAALDRLIRDVNSTLFPMKMAEAKQSLQHSPLANPREVLVRNFVQYLLGELITKPLQHEDARRKGAALRAVVNIHPDHAERGLKKHVNSGIGGLENEHLDKAVRFLWEMPQAWQHLDAQQRHRLDSFVKTLPPNSASPTVAFALQVEGLHGAAVTRIASATILELEKLVAGSPRPEFVPRAAELLENAGSYDAANVTIKKILLPLAPVADEPSVKRLLTAVKNNAQVRHSYEAKTLVETLYQSSGVGPARVAEFIQELGVMDVYAPPGVEAPAQVEPAGGA